MELESYYVFELSYYTAGIVIHVLIDQPLKDFYVMLFHHIITICLVGFSYFWGLHRIGMLILMVHDVSDVFLDYAKCFHYLELVFPRFRRILSDATQEFFSTITFVNLIISWIVYRLYLYPAYCVYSAFFESWEVLVVEEVLSLA